MIFKFLFPLLFFPFAHCGQDRSTKFFGGTATDHKDVMMNWAGNFSCLPRMRKRDPCPFSWKFLKLPICRWRPGPVLSREVTFPRVKKSSTRKPAIGAYRQLVFALGYCHPPSFSVHLFANLEASATQSDLPERISTPRVIATSEVFPLDSRPSPF